jgi:hypothetical protein
MPATMPKATSTSKGSGAKRPDEEGQRRVDTAPTLPYAKAFVVQFTAETGSRLEPATGRVEHLLTGQRFRFASIADLVAGIRTLLASSTSPSSKRGRSAARARRGVSRGG